MSQPRISPPFARPLYWPAIPAPAAVREWEDLRDWVDSYVARFAVDSRTIPACWYRHNGMVEALSALRDHERASYEYATSKDAALGFLRAAADVGVLLREFAARSGCTASGHRADPARCATDDEDWHAFLQLVIARRNALHLDDGQDPTDSDLPGA